MLQSRSGQPRPCSSRVVTPCLRRNPNSYLDLKSVLTRLGPRRVGRHSIPEIHTTAQTHVGIDVAKHHLALAVWGAEDIDRLPHDQESIEARCHRVTALAPDRIVVEATALQAVGWPVAVVNPRQARAFGCASGQLAKTDRLEARRRARMAAVLQPSVRPLPDTVLQALGALVVRRRPVVAMCAREKTRLDTTAAAMRPRIQAHLD